MIPITKVQLGVEEEELVLRALRSGQLAQGPLVGQLEARCREMAGVEHAVAVNNGTTALVLALEALQLQPGDEVITSPFTFVATLNAILEAGATARFGDIGDDFNLDPASVAPLVNERTRVVMPVHLYGQPADMPAFERVAAESGARLVEDCAQSHFATVAGRPVGGYGVGCFSFYATKNVMCGEGGVITTDDAALADRMRVLRNQGMRVRYQYELPGHNYRLTDLAAAVALPQFDRISGHIEARRRNAARLIEGLSGIPGLVLPSVAPGRTHVWHQFTVRVTPDAPVDRDALAGGLERLGIGHGFYYPRAVYDYECYRSHPRVHVDGSPRAEQIASEVVSLPVHPYLTDDELDRIVAGVREAVGC